MLVLLQWDLFSCDIIVGTERNSLIKQAWLLQKPWKLHLNTTICTNNTFIVGGYRLLKTIQTHMLSWFLWFEFRKCRKGHTTAKLLWAMIIINLEADIRGNLYNAEKKRTLYRYFGEPRSPAITCIWNVGNEFIRGILEGISN